MRARNAKEVISEYIKDEADNIAESIIDKLQSRADPEDVYDAATLETWAEEHDFIHKDNI